MGTPGNAHRTSTMILSLLMAIIGVALIVQAVVRHASLISPRLLLAVLFVAAGVGRIYVETRRGQHT
jgi:prolipoprotein diacylglyceryltransferase